VKPKDFGPVTERLQQAVEQFDGRPDAGGEPDPPSNIRSVQMQIDAIGRGDLDAVLSQAHDDVTLDIFAPREFAFIRHAQGLADLRRAIEQNFAAVEDQRPEIANVFAEGDTVVLFGREQGRIRATGQPYDMEFVERFTFREGRLAAIRIIAAHTAPKA
jgi:uncharacterized protein